MLLRILGCIFCGIVFLIALLLYDKSVASILLGLSLWLTRCIPPFLVTFILFALGNGLEMQDVHLNYTLLLILIAGYSLAQSQRGTHLLKLIQGSNLALMTCTALACTILPNDALLALALTIQAYDLPTQRHRLISLLVSSNLGSLASPFSPNTLVLLQGNLDDMPYWKVLLIGFVIMCVSVLLCWYLFKCLYPESTDNASNLERVQDGSKERSDDSRTWIDLEKGILKHSPNISTPNHHTPNIVKEIKDKSYIDASFLVFAVASWLIAGLMHIDLGIASIPLIVLLYVFRLDERHLRVLPWSTIIFACGASLMSTLLNKDALLSSLLRKLLIKLILCSSLRCTLLSTFTLLVSILLGRLVTSLVLMPLILECLKELVHGGLVTKADASRMALLACLSISTSILLPISSTINLTLYEHKFSGKKKVLGSREWLLSVPLAQLIAWICLLVLGVPLSLALI